MTENRDYEVLRLIEHKNICYISADNVKGCSLVGWVKHHPYMKKKDFQQWICEMGIQMLQIHQSKGNPCYQYVNPYSIIISENDTIHYLDLSAASNRGKVNIMNRRNIRSQFLPEQEKYYQNISEKLDMYGLGKTIEYILAFVEIEPKFNGHEERIIRKIIKLCTSDNNEDTFTKVEKLKNYLQKLRIK